MTNTNDMAEESREVTKGWLNVYRYDNHKDVFTYHDTKRNADDINNPVRIACVEVEYTVGEGTLSPNASWAEQNGVDLSREIINGWVNIYRYEDYDDYGEDIFILYETREMADLANNPFRIACIKIEYTVGEGT